MSYRLRNMEPRDLPRVWRIAAAQNRRDGTNYPVPSAFQMDESKPGFGLQLPSVPLALVTERDGRVCQATYFLRTIEVMGFGGGELDFGYAHIPMAMDFLKRRGYDEAHAFVPAAAVSEAHSKLLETYGFARLDHRLAHFFRMT